MLRQADPKWIFVGCIIPDVPWILQRIVRPVITDPDLLYDLRLYTIAQASLICCLLLCGAFAVLSANPGRIFAILSLNSCFHLLLDAFQTKWGNGVHLLAPLRWEAVNFGLFWPESPVTVALTAFGAVYCALFWWRGTGKPVGLTVSSPRRIGMAAILAAKIGRAHV